MRSADAQAPSLSVVIPTSRGGADLEACVASLDAEHYPALEVIIVDNGSRGSLDQLLGRFAGVQRIRNDENRGFAEAANQGIDASRGEFVLVFNDDAQVEPGALRALVDALASRPAWGACQAKLLLMDDPTRLDTAGSFLTATGFLIHRGAFGPEQRFNVSDEIFAAKGAALLLRRRALADVGCFDADFFAYFEETDLCWRLWVAGWKVGFAADARVLHRLGSTSSKMLPAIVQFHSFKNRICALVKNVDNRTLVTMLPCHLGLCLGVAAWYLLHGRFRLAWAIVRAITWNVTRFPRTLEKRREIQSRRRVPDRELMPQIKTRTPFRTLLAYARGEAAPEAEFGLRPSEGNEVT